MCRAFRAAAALALVLLGTGAGCFTEFPGVTDDAGPFATSDALEGASPSGDGPPSAPGHPSSAGPPPSAPGSAPDTDAAPPPPECTAGLCEACTGDGTLMGLTNDVRCPPQDCVHFERAERIDDAGLGIVVCRIFGAHISATCAGPEQCAQASAATCLVEASPRVEVRTLSDCNDIVDCVAGGAPRVAPWDRLHPCDGGRGMCDGAGNCLPPDPCLSIVPSAPDQTCGQVVGAAAGTCRFYQSAAPSVMSCLTFCAIQTMQCAAAYENVGAGCTPDLARPIECYDPVVDSVCDCQPHGNSGGGNQGGGGNDWGH